MRGRRDTSSTRHPTEGVPQPLSAVFPPNAPFQGLLFSYRLCRLLWVFPRLLPFRLLGPAVAASGDVLSMSTHPAPPCRATYLAPGCSVGQRSRGRRSLPVIVLVLTAALLVVCVVYSDKCVLSKSTHLAPPCRAYSAPESCMLVCVWWYSCVVVLHGGE